MTFIQEFLLKALTSYLSTPLELFEIYNQDLCIHIDKLYFDGYRLSKTVSFRNGNLALDNVLQ